MEMIQLYGTDLKVSRLCMGAGNFGAVLDQQRANTHLDRFMELGGNFVDTAHVYCDWIPGEKNSSEKMLGRWLRMKRREEVIICTKGGHFDLATPGISRVTPEEITADLNESLACLQTDYIDLYMLHRDNPALPVKEIMDCMDAFVREGKVRYLACSNWTAERTAEANQYAVAHGKAPFVVNELMWSMAQPNPETVPADNVVMDEKMMAYGMETHMNFMCFAALARGYFTRRFDGKPLSENLHRTYDNEYNERLFQQLRLLDSGRAVTHASLRYFADQPVTAVPIVSFSNMDQLMECAQAFE